MRVHLIDGTYELYRHHYALPPAADLDGNPVAAVVGVLGSMLTMIQDGATHLGVATDHIIESFRNELWPGYKTGVGIEPALAAQFHPLERALAAMGVAVWPMIELEADDALASAARLASLDPCVERVLICTPDKDLSQCVVADRVVQLDRRKRELRDEAGVVARFGIPPAAIPDFLALVGDSADGFPGVPGWGPKSAAALLSRYGRLEAIPPRAADWAIEVRGATRLAESLEANRVHVMLFRRLATLVSDAPLFQSVDEIRWRGPAPEFEDVARQLGASRLWTWARELASRSAPAAAAPALPPDDFSPGDPPG